MYGIGESWSTRERHSGYTLESMKSGYLVHCHPDPNSFTASVAERVAGAFSDHEIVHTTVDLYREGFEPTMPMDEFSRKFSFDAEVQRHVALLEESTHLAIVHPDWWGTPPALLKGWVDRVFRPGVAYEFEGAEFAQKKSSPLLAGTRAIVFVTSNDESRDAIPVVEPFWRNVFRYSGIAPHSVHVLQGFHSLDSAGRISWLASIPEKIRAWI